MFTRIARHTIPAVVLVAAGLALTACGPDDSSSSGASSAASAGSSAGTGGSDAAGQPDQSGQSATSPSSTGGSESKDAAGSATAVAACATSNLKITEENRSSGAGHTTFQLVFQNTGTQNCTLRGYPGVSFVKTHNTQLGKAATRSAGSAKTVTLIPNAHAYADVQTINGQGGYSATECELTNVPTLRVYPPNQTESANIPWNERECVGSSVQNLQVGPVHGNK